MIGHSYLPCIIFRRWVAYLFRGGGAILCAGPLSRKRRNNRAPNAEAMGHPTLLLRSFLPEQGPEKCPDRQEDTRQYADDAGEDDRRFGQTGMKSE